VVISALVGTVRSDACATTRLLRVVSSIVNRDEQALESARFSRPGWRMGVLSKGVHSLMGKTYSVEISAKAHQKSNE